MSNPTGWERPESVEPEIVETEVVEPAEVPEPEVAPGASEATDDVVDAVLVEVTDETTVATDAVADESLPAVDAPADATDVLADDQLISSSPAPRLALDDAEPEPPAPTSFEVDSAPAAPDTPVTPAAPPGGSWLDLPPLADIPYTPPASTAPVEAAAPGVSGFTPLPGQGSYRAPEPSPQYTQPSFGADYGQQAAGQSYGHGAQAAPAPSQPGTQYQYPSTAPYPPAAGQQVPYAPYGTPSGAAPGYGMQPYQYGTDTTSASMAHWLAILLGFLGPLIMMLTRGQQDPVVRANAVESLNFQLTLMIGYLASFLLTFVFIGVAGFVVLPILGLVFPILGAVAANRGEVYHYPVKIPFVK